MARFGQGRPTAHPEIYSIAPLTQADLDSYEPAEISQEPSSIKKLRDSHHRIAHYFAMGLRNFEIEEITGYSKARLSTLRASPAMKELVEYYRKEVVETRQVEADQTFTSLVRLRNLATTELIDRFEDDEAREKLSNGHLIALVADGLDRTGYPKRKENVNFNQDFASRLDRAISASNKAKVIEHIPSPPDHSSNQQTVLTGGGLGETANPPQGSSPPVPEILPPRRKLG